MANLTSLLKSLAMQYLTSPAKVPRAIRIVWVAWRECNHNRDSSILSKAWQMHINEPCSQHPCAHSDCSPSFHTLHGHARQVGLHAPRASPKARRGCCQGFFCNTADLDTPRCHAVPCRFFCKCPQVPADSTRWQSVCMRQLKARVSAAIIFASEITRLRLTALLNSTTSQRITLLSARAEQRT